MDTKEEVNVGSFFVSSFTIVLAIFTILATLTHVAYDQLVIKVNMGVYRNRSKKN